MTTTIVGESKTFAQVCRVLELCARDRISCVTGNCPVKRRCLRLFDMCANKNDGATYLATFQQLRWGKLPQRQPADRKIDRRIRIVAHAFKVRPHRLLTKDKRPAAVLARQVAMYILRRDPELTLANTGALLGGRCPSTIHHGFKAIAQRFTWDTELKRKTESLVRRI